MPFFYPRTIYHAQRPQPSFNPLFALLNELEGCPGRSNQSCHPKATHSHTVQRWEPRFTIRETKDAYLVRGEVPGLNKSHVSVEFPEPRKLVVSAKFDTRHDEPTAPTEQAQLPTEKPQAEDDAVSTVSETATETKSVSSYQATVEDDDEADDFEVVSHSSKATQEKEESPVEKQQEQVEQPIQEPQPQPFAHRSGEFSRYFKFPLDVEHDQVTADLKDGLLTITIPKLKQAEPRRITIQ